MERSARSQSNEGHSSSVSCPQYLYKCDRLCRILNMKAAEGDLFRYEITTAVSVAQPIVIR